MIVMSWYLTLKTILPSLIAPVLLIFANEGCNMCIEGEKAQNREVQYFILLPASSYVYAMGIEKLNPTLENAHLGSLRCQAGLSIRSPVILLFTYS